MTHAANCAALGTLLFIIIIIIIVVIVVIISPRLDSLLVLLSSVGMTEILRC